MSDRPSRKKGTSMTEVPVQHQITMPASLMHAIEAVCASDMKSAEKYVATVLICHGYGLWERQTSFDPTSYAIPETQWGEICTLLMDLTDGDAIAKVNASLDWVNQGPSGYKESA